MKNELLTVSEAAARIGAGDILTIAGSDRLLRQLPKGRWIGGTTVYLLTDDGAARIEDRLFCTTFDTATEATVRHIAPQSLPSLASGYHDGGVTVILLPGFSKAHADFALNGASYDGLFNQPLTGWITGVPVEEIGKTAPAAFDGMTGTRHEEGAVALHLALPAGSRATLDIVNIFGQDETEASFSFPATGFTTRNAQVDGETVNFAAYLTEAQIDTRLPLVANYAGALVNVSVRAVDAASGDVSFYAPVVAGVEYRLARNVPDYAEAFRTHLADGGAGQLSCNCILNYLYGEMEGKKTGRFTGPVTFGEIAYILLNQTLVRLDIAA